MAPIRLAIIGCGKIAMDQHIPTLRHDPAFRLVAVVDPVARADGLATYPSLEALGAALEVDAVSVCTPPQARYTLARAALEAGKHVLLEKPPCATTGELAALEDLARSRGLTLFTAWHAQHAPAVPAARDWLAGRGIQQVEVTWAEDVRRWHPGQAWIWKAGGLGVFDPGINALSILCALFPQPIFWRSAHFETPANADTPAAATLKGFAGDATLAVNLNFLQTGPQTWTIDVLAEDGRLILSSGGAALSLDGVAQATVADTEYASLYRRFAALIDNGAREVDGRPLALVADAFLIANTTVTEPFIE